MLRLSATVWKCPDFLPEMSGILDTRILPFCNSAFKSLTLKYFMSMHYSKWSSIQWSLILKMSLRDKYLKLPSNLANCTIWNISQDFSFMNVFRYLNNGKAVLMFENHIKSENIGNLTRPSQIAQLLRNLRSFLHKNYLLYIFVNMRWVW